MDNTDNMNVNTDMQTGAEERPEPLTGADPGTLANAIAHFLDGKKARDIRIINMTERPLGVDDRESDRARYAGRHRTHPRVRH